MKQNIFTSQSTCMEVFISLLCLFVHEPPYQIYTSVLQSRFFAAVHHTWTTVPFSMGSIRLYFNNNIYTLIYYSYTYLSTCITWLASHSNASRSAVTIIIIFDYVIVSAQALITIKCFVEAYQSTWLTDPLGLRSMEVIVSCY